MSRTRELEPELVVGTWHKLFNSKRVILFVVAFFFNSALCTWKLKGFSLLHTNLDRNAATVAGQKTRNGMLVYFKTMPPCSIWASQSEKNAPL